MVTPATRRDGVVGAMWFVRAVHLHGHVVSCRSRGARSVHPEGC